MEIIDKEQYKLITFKVDNAVFVFTTGENNINFDFRNEANAHVLKDIKMMLKLNDVGYLKQIHGTDISIYGDDMREGDGILTDVKNVAVGVFTADCVPILIFDAKNQVCGAIHSGWRGTYNKIAIAAIDRMKQEYGTSAEDVYVVIGPHIEKCCYEIGDEVIQLFQKDKLYERLSIINERKLDMGLCITAQLKSKGVKEENIKETNYCTHCSDEIKFHSYRRDKSSSGRMFSFVYISQN